MRVPTQRVDSLANWNHQPVPGPCGLRESYRIQDMRKKSRASNRRVNGRNMADGRSIIRLRHF